MWPPSLVTATGGPPFAIAGTRAAQPTPVPGPNTTRAADSGAMPAPFAITVTSLPASISSPYACAAKSLISATRRRPIAFSRPRALTCHGALVNFASSSTEIGAATARQATSTSSSALPASCR